MDASCKVLMVVVIFVVSMVKQALAKQYVVGGSQGWDESTDYNSWTSDKTFRTGDQLVFKYSALHSVVELGSESAYKSCDTGTSVDSLNGGNNVVKLTKPGTRYFVCGTMGHCGQGMKVKITTVAADSTSTTPDQSSSSTPTSTSASEAPAFHMSSASFMVALLVFSLLFVF